MVSGSVFLSKRTQSTRFFLVDTPEEIELKTAPSVSDETSIITREHYIHISPKTEFADVGVISNFPEARNRRAAYREPTQRASAKRMGDLVDPRDFFAFNSHEETFGDKLAFYARVIKGEFGAEQQARSDSLKMYVAHLGDETLYRIVQELNGPDRRYVVSDWGSTVDFLPLRMAITADENGEEVVQEVRVDWKTIDGVYIPNQAIATGIVEGGKTGYRREANLITCEINSPLDPHQFDYQGLGLKDGELVIDEIENVVYVINGGALDKLTDFGAEYVPQESSGGIKGGSHQK
jgi:hypothetical protein